MPTTVSSDVFSPGFKGDGVPASVPSDFNLEAAREGIDHRYADAVQAAREAVVFISEFGAGVESGHDNLDTGHLLLRMPVDGHAATVIDHLQRLVRVVNDLDLTGEPGDGLVHRVVDDFLGEMVGARRVRVHAGPAPDRIESPEDLE